MKLEIERGNVQDVAPAEKNGASSCHINDRYIKLHRDLADSVKSGEDLMVAGTLRNKEFYALALKDIAKDKVSGIDCTNYILLMGLGIILFIMFGIFGMQEDSGHVLIKDVEEGISLIGFGIAAFFVRYVLQVNGAVSSVTHFIEEPRS